MCNLDHINSTNHRTSIIYRWRVNLRVPYKCIAKRGISRVIKPTPPPLLSHRAPSLIIPRSCIVRPDGTLNARRLPSTFPNCESSNARATRILSCCTLPMAEGAATCGDADLRGDDGKCCYTRDRLGVYVR